MNLNKPPKAAMSTLIRRALMNRYDYNRVTIDRDGNVAAHIDMRDRWGPTTKTHPYGNLAMWSWQRTESMGIALYFQTDPTFPGTLIFKFAPDT